MMECWGPDASGFDKKGSDQEFVGDQVSFLLLTLVCVSKGFEKGDDRVNMGKDEMGVENTFVEMMTF